MEETDKSKFKKTIDKVAVEMKGNVAAKIFGDYFEKNYKLKCKQWVICYREQIPICMWKHFTTYLNINFLMEKIAD